MANSKHGRTIGASLKLETISSDIVFEKARNDLVSPERRGRSSSGLPRYFKHHEPKSTGRTTEPGIGFGSLSPGAADLVYPIRSVVSISQPLQRTPCSPDAFWGSGNSSAGSIADEAPAEVCVGLGIHRSRSGSPRNLPGETSVASAGTMSERALELGSACVPSLVEGLSASGEEETTDNKGVVLGGRNQLVRNDASESYMTTRFEHIVTGDGHCVVTGVSGSESMQRCEDEPIHIPGAVQGFGVLLALKEDADRKLNVKVVSENSQLIMGYSPSALFALDDFCDILSEEQAEILYEHLDFVRNDSSESVHPRPEVFPFIIIAPDSTNIKFLCAIHIPQGNLDLIVCELELEDDQLFPLFSPADEASSPLPPEDTLHSNPSEQELLESTTSISKSLRVLRHTRKRRGQAAALEVFGLMSQIQEQLSSELDLDTFLKVAVGILKELTGFHRVMIYQFDENWNGLVVTELVDSSATTDLYKGLNFPASDIPKQARDLYRVNKVRLLYDRDQETARLVCKSKKYLDKPLDMTHSYLRAMSPIHIKYLKNMAVRASMSISITAFGELWGLVSCHTYGQKGMRVNFSIRKMCGIISEAMSRNVERLSYESKLQAQHLINTVPTEQNPTGYIVAGSDDLLKLFGADFGLLSIGEETKVLGKLDHPQEALALLEYLRMRKFTSVTTSQGIKFDFLDLSYGPGFSTIAGLLLVPLSMGGKDFIVFFRKGQLKIVNWAGNPYAKILREGTQGYLEPRTSFRAWTETVVGRCKAWTENQIETAAVLCLVYGKFIEVWRQKEAALQNSQLTKLLLANASHEIRTPLNAIINYLEIALEGPLDLETRDNLMRSHSASKSLIYVINDLLDLTRTENGQDLVMDKVFDLSNTVHEAISLFKSDAERKSISLVVVEYPGLPQLVRGDQSRLRQAISNIICNAVKNTSVGGVKIELWTPETLGDRCRVEIAIQDTGIGISPRRLSLLFQEFEQVQTGEDTSKEPSQAGQTFDDDSKISGQKVLGLGLAIVARTIRNVNGQLRLRSEEGKGSRFTIIIPFVLPSESEKAEANFRPLSPRVPLPLPQSMPLPSGQDPTEFSLADQPSLNIAMESKNSSSSMGSLVSTSSGRSEIGTVHVIANESSVFLRPTTSKPSLLSKSGAMGPRCASPPGLTAPNLQPDREAIAISTALPRVDMQAKSPSISSREASPGSSAVRFYKKSLNHEEPAENHPVRFKVLVAEDDPINCKIIKKRMERLGHDVTLTVNGAECVDFFMKNSEKYDIVLMDMQMPIMDGGTSTTRIRGLESSGATRGISMKHRSNGRIPIFAVSASLFEEKREEYINLGFDGWVLKPVNFERLRILMDGILHPSVRKNATYQPGIWEQGGWFSELPTELPGILEETSSAVPETQEPELLAELPAILEETSSAVPETQEPELLAELPVILEETSTVVPETQEPPPEDF